MNLLARVKMSSNLIFRTPLPPKPLFNLRPIAALQHLTFYSTKTVSYTSPKTQQLKKPRTQKPSEPLSSNFSKNIKKQTDVLTTVWQKPTEIPYQEKVVNFVNLIGYVKAPVQFESKPDGTHFASAVISQENGGERNSLLIPVVFEGDLAHVVSCHVKENDCVFVSGRLGVDPMGIVFSEKSLGKFHVVVENLNFVEGFKRSVSDKNVGVSYLGLAMEKKSVPGEIEVVSETLDYENDEGFKEQWEEALEHAKAKRASSISVEKSVGGHLDAVLEASTASEANYDDGSYASRQETRNGRSGGKKKNGEETMQLWRDLVKNPLQWWDYRDHKANGLVKEKFPDFKQKGSGESLWINTAPGWIMLGLGKMEFDVKDVKPKLAQTDWNRSDEGTSQGTKSGKFDASWKSLVENPSKWWDNRMNKKNPKQPDFKHKETGEALWLSSGPAWALSEIPPLKDGQGVFDGKKSFQAH